MPRYRNYIKPALSTAGKVLVGLGTRDLYRAAKKKYSSPAKRMSSKPLILEGFPKQKLVKLRYCQEVSIDPGSGLAASVNFAANALYRPYLSTPYAHDPMGFDQWSQIYTRYTVLGSKISMVPVSSAPVNLIPSYYGVLLTTNASGVAQFTTVPNILESKLVTKHASQGSLYQSTPLGKNTVHKTFSAKKFFGVKNVQDGNSYSAGIAAHPNQLAYFNVWSASAGSNNPDAATFLITITYIALMHDPVTLNGSV